MLQSEVSELCELDTIWQKQPNPLVCVSRREAWLKIVLTVLIPSFRYVNTSLKETFVGLYGPPSGGFRASWPLLLFQSAKVGVL